MKILRCFLIIYLVIFCQSEPLPCKDCALRKTNLPVEQLKQLRYEYIKNQILNKLHLMEPPKINLPKPQLNSLLVIAEMTQNETTLEIENIVKTESIVIYPKNENYTCSEHESYLCNKFEFSAPESVLLENILSAEVWIYKNNTNSLRAYQAIKDRVTNTSKNYELNITAMERHSRSWSKYGVLTDSFWSNNVSKNIISIEVIKDRNETDTDNIARGADEILFLVIRSEVAGDKKSNRQKRSYTCIDSSPSCCKENFYLNFSEIGWDNWILHPDGYQANFCRGRCFNDLSNTRFYHSAVLLSFIRDNKDIAEEIGLSMCCTPSVMAPITIFYRNEEGMIYQKSIENMKVEACDCA